MRETEIPAISFAAGVTALALAAGLLAVFLAEVFFNIMPCHLCLQQRWPYYIGAVLALVLSIFAYCRFMPLSLLKLGMLMLIAVLCWSLYLGTQHSGMEWGWWAAPADCTQDGNILASVKDLATQLKTAKVVPCDAPAWKLLGVLSFANLNALLSVSLLVLNISTLAGFDPRRFYGSSTESQYR